MRMADAGLPVPPALQALLAPQGLQAPQAPQPPILPNQLEPTQLIQHMPQFNWSHFKTEFTGKPKEDSEAHLLRMND